MLVSLAILSAIARIFGFLALLVPGILVLGVVGFAVLVLSGSRPPIMYSCSQCGKRLESEDVRICPRCSHSLLDGE